MAMFATNDTHTDDNECCSSPQVSVAKRRARPADVKTQQRTDYTPAVFSVDELSSHETRKSTP